ncbi:carbohydrate ABC transporter substrate-binding protein [Streptomyces armeniacus]|uniref:Carbohydrate ABC transporter substrate-binding protein n=1 Tax=Streptomyces armeniacus TaxID=83291 RepID=A0A345XK38_9ACTN|nr:ABC transporter substrate-binding protein [Streptomyces armeniacus]AXK32004.1 carbohydrate ABC transporter substrate-binding protein [Streptomyces armeniacus]
MAQSTFSDRSRSPRPPLPSRRALLRGTAAGAGAITLPALLSACSQPGDGPVSVGSNASDKAPKKAYEEVFGAFKKTSDKDVEVNTVDHNSFQENINRYLKGSPDDVFMWFAGYRMQFFAKQGLLTEISDLWKGFNGFSEALRKQSSGEDGKQYFVPYYYYPWAVFHRKSVFDKYGYEQPRTFDEFRALAAKMEKDGLIPLAFGDKDGWPAMGTFDYLNMRANGYDFHLSLMRGRESWTDKRVRQVFDLWRGLMPYHQKGANGRTWQEAAQTLVAKKSGMTVLGLQQPGQQFPAEDQDDLDFFPFPEIDPAIGTDAVEAPIDGFLMAKKVRNEDGARELLKYLATPKAEEAYTSSDPTCVAVHKNADTSGYSALQKKSAELISSAKQISQFMDRDTRPDFASTVMIQAIQRFINEPDDIDGLVKDIETQKKDIFDA